MIDEFETQITLDIDELMAAIESLQETIGLRLRYLLDPGEAGFRSRLDFATFQLHVRWIVNTYGKLLMSFRAQAPDADITQRWIETVDLPPAVWKILDDVLLGASWSEFSPHVDHPEETCHLCEFWDKQGL